MHAGFFTDYRGWFAIMPDPDMDGQGIVSRRIDSEVGLVLHLDAWRRRN